MAMRARRATSGESLRGRCSTFRPASTTAAAASRRTITMTRSGPSGTVSRTRAPIEEPTNPAAKPSAARS